MFLCFSFYHSGDLAQKGSHAKSVLMESWIAMKAVMKVRTFQIIVLQGIIGSLPWTAMVFFTMWFELIGELSVSQNVLCSFSARVILA